MRHCKESAFEAVLCNQGCSCGRLSLIMWPAVLSFPYCQESLVFIILYIIHYFLLLLQSIHFAVASYLSILPFPILAHYTLEVVQFLNNI